MTATQLSLFSNGEDQNLDRRQKKAKLGRYERLQRELELKNQDPYKIFVEAEIPTTPTSTYTFVDLFCGAGGMTQGLAQAGFEPSRISSPRSSALVIFAHLRRFPSTSPCPGAPLDIFGLPHSSSTSPRLPALPVKHLITREPGLSPRSGI